MHFICSAVQRFYKVKAPFPRHSAPPKLQTHILPVVEYSPKTLALPSYLPVNSLLRHPVDPFSFRSFWTERRSIEFFASVGSNKKKHVKPCG